MRIVETSGIFDGEEYLELHEDVRASGMHPADHYIRYGDAERRVVTRNAAVQQNIEFAHFSKRGAVTAIEFLATASIGELTARESSRHDVERILRPAQRSIIAGVRAARPLSEIAWGGGSPACTDDRAATLVDPRLDTIGSVGNDCRSDSVDVVICVHNALDYVRECLSSILLNWDERINLVLVDDGSEAVTQEYLARFAARTGCGLIRRENAGGYTVAANTGVMATKADWVVLLNSDTIVTRHWIERLLRAASSRPRVGIVGPLSNAASWQSVPERFDEDGDWRVNPYIGGSPDAAARYLARRRPVYPVLPFVNGFCFMIRRSVLDEIGAFDTVHFRAGYGEENDLCIRARNANWNLVIADDAFVGHSHSKSYSHRRTALTRRADRNLLLKHRAEDDIFRPAQFCRDSLAMSAVRAESVLADELESLRRSNSQRFGGRTMYFVLPANAEGGGASVIAQEVGAIQECGVEVVILNYEHNRTGFAGAYPNLRGEYFHSDAELAAYICMNATKDDAVVTTVWHSTRVIGLAKRFGCAAKWGYYIQDFEPMFYQKGSRDYRDALATYKLGPDVKMVTKTNWNRTQILAAVPEANVSVVGPSVDLDRFFPSDSPTYPPRAVRVCAMVRPETPRRNPEVTATMLADISEAMPSVAVFSFGCTDEALLDVLRARIHLVKNLGKLSRLAVPVALRNMDVFVDLSHYQAMGLTALEAMRSGCVVFAPESGGSKEFIEHGVNGYLSDAPRLETLLGVIERIQQRDRSCLCLRQRAVESASRFHPLFAGTSLLCAIFGAQNDSKA